MAGRAQYRFRGVSVEATTKFGPLLLARRMLEPQGRWDALLDDLRRLLADRRPAEYLVVTGSKS